MAPCGNRGRSSRRCCAGASDRRIAMHGKAGNLLLLAQSINELIDSVSTTVAETVEVVGRAVEGDLDIENEP